MVGLSFAKMHGCGNDFILIDDRAGDWLGRDEALAAVLCDRRRGVGADGMILLRSADDHDFRMRFINADGLVGEMCGNGARCAVRFAHGLGMGQGGRLRLATEAGTISAEIQQDRVRLNMTAPVQWVEDIRIAVDGRAWRFTSIETGPPHIVALAPDLGRLDVPHLGRAIRSDPVFAPRGTNVNFYRIDGAGTVSMRTYERGVEAETLACGTGAVAVALAASEHHGLGAPVGVKTYGGDRLDIGFERLADRTYDAITLTGPATLVSTGTVDAGWLADAGLAR